MNAELDAKTLNAAKEEISALLDEHWERVCQARSAAALAASEAGKDKFSYKVNLAISMEPMGDECSVSASISYSVTHKDQTDTRLVSNQPELGL